MLEDISHTSGRSENSSRTAGPANKNSGIRPPDSLIAVDQEVTEQYGRWSGDQRLGKEDVVTIEVNRARCVWTMSLTSPTTSPATGCRPPRCQRPQPAAQPIGEGRPETDAPSLLSARSKSCKRQAERFPGCGPSSASATSITVAIRKKSARAASPRSGIRTRRREGRKQNIHGDVGCVAECRQLTPARVETRNHRECAAADERHRGNGHA